MVDCNKDTIMSDIAIGSNRWSAGPVKRCCAAGYYMAGLVYLTSNGNYDVQTINAFYSTANGLRGWM